MKSKLKAHTANKDVPKKSLSKIVISSEIAPHISQIKTKRSLMGSLILQGKDLNNVQSGR